MKECCETGAAPARPEAGHDGPLTIGIAGNPNCGKTTLFNNLTGARQRVGNWPGVTVDRKEGLYNDAGGQIRVVDLPGVYTLGVLPGLEAQSLDEKLARDNILSGDIDVIVNIIDAGNLERNLYLTAQMIEMKRPMVVALNMMDVAANQGIKVDADRLSRRLGCPVVTMVAARSEGMGPLIDAVRDVVARGATPARAVTFPTGVEHAIQELIPAARQAAETNGVDPRWLAARLLESDDLARTMTGNALDERVADLLPGIEGEHGEDADILIADGRFTFAHEIAEAVSSQSGRAKRRTSDALDRIVLSRIGGPLIFLGLMYLMFMFTINLGGAFIDFFDLTAGALFVDGVKELLGLVNAPKWLQVLLADGIGGGIQVVATFIPIIGFLYFLMSILEDSGYMARAAFLMDRLMRVVGLPGKSFVPLIVGFGCNVPAIMASRTLDQQRDRLMTVMMSPFMSCGARLTIYALFAAAFFPTGGQNIVFALYLIGIIAAIGTGLLLKHTLLKGETTPFAMELPPYHLPRLKDVLIHSWIRLKSFIFGAGKIIVMVVTILAFLNSFGTDGSFGNEDSDKSILSSIGRVIVPVFNPMGIDERNWPATVGLFTGIFAKEAVVGTLDSLYSGLAKPDSAASAAPEAYDLPARLGEAVTSIGENLSGLGDLFTDPLGLGAVRFEGLDKAAEAQEVSTGTFGAMAQRFDGAVGAFAYLLFLLLYFPCVAALGAIKNEAGGRWATFAALWTTGLAYSVSVIFYQGATFMRHPAASALWIGLLIVLMAGFVALLRLVGQRPAAAPLTATE